MNFVFLTKTDIFSKISISLYTLLVMSLSSVLVINTPFTSRDSDNKYTSEDFVYYLTYYP